MPTDGERLATVEAVLRELRGDMRDLNDETQRTRKRLHDLEGTTGMLVDQEKKRREATQTRQRRLEVRIQILTVVIACAALFEPVLYHFAGGN